jgi:hypothetical protein
MTNAEKRPPGTPPGVVKNPQGINQYTGLEQRGQSISVRLPISLDADFRLAVSVQGLTITAALAEAIEHWLITKPENKL